MTTPTSTDSLLPPKSGAWYRRLTAALHRRIEVICCCPAGVDWLWVWLVATVLLGALVVAGGQLLRVSVDLGLPAFLAGGEVTEPVVTCHGEMQLGERSVLVHACWDPVQRLWAGGLALLDSLWALVYAPFLALLFLRLFSELASDRHGGRCADASHSSGSDHLGGLWRDSLLLRLAIVVVGLLLVADLIENLLTLLIAARDSLDASSWMLGILHWSSGIKLVSAIVVVLWALIVFCLWLFGLRILGATTQHEERREQRAQLRRAIDVIFWRSRYVLAMLVLFGFLALGMDQSRDVLVGMAQGFQDWGWLPAAVLVLVAAVIGVLMSLPVAAPGDNAVVGTSPGASSGLRRWAEWVPLGIVAVILAAVGVGSIGLPWLRLPAAVLYSLVAVWLLAYAAWLWSRILARLCPPNVSQASDEPSGADQFAKWWARLLGLAPLLLLISLAGLASGDATLAWQAAPGGADAAQQSAIVLFLFAVLTGLLAGAVLRGFVADRGRQEQGAEGRPQAETEPHGRCGAAAGKRSRYFQVVRPGKPALRDELAGSRYRFPLLLPNAPLWLPIIALACFELVRVLDLVWGGSVPLTLAAIACAVTLWTCALGLLAQAALRGALPWVLLLLLLVGALGLLGWTDNHRVLTEAYPQPDGNGILWGIWAAQAALALLVAFALYWGWKRSISDGIGWVLVIVGAIRAWLLWLKHLFQRRSAQPDGPHWRTSLIVDWAVYVVLAGLAIGVLRLSDVLLSPKPAADELLAREHSLDESIKDWVEELVSKAAPGEAIPVYFVSAEGGGIRSAYWTALVLDQLDRSAPGDEAAGVLGFSDRTFSISGVSGGSIGAAAWQVCRGQRPSGADAVDGRCIDKLAEANLLTPLLSSWLFDDALAQFVPTSLCRAPGCGVLSRGHAFERSLEAALPGLADPLVQANAQSPYLFLNSTRVEDGNRAIASVVPTDRGSFPSSADQLCVLGPYLPLSTAAHNSARFTYVNAIGAAGVGHGAAFRERYHLADGGYFDNSGGHTTADILRAFMRCLFAPENPCGIAPTARETAARWLLPQAIQIRNGMAPRSPDADLRSVNADVGEHRCPQVPHAEQEDLNLYTNLLGPVVTAFNTIGTGANGRVAEADICRTVRAWRLLRLALQPKQDPGPVEERPLILHCDLVDAGVLYPLGWYLSTQARDAMQDARDGLDHRCLPGPAAADD